MWNEIRETKKKKFEGGKKVKGGFQISDQGEGTSLHISTAHTFRIYVTISLV